MNKYFKISAAKVARQNIKQSKFELSSTQRERLRNISQAVLAVMAVGGMVLLSAAAPNVLQLISNAKKLKKFFNGLNSKEKQRKVMKSFYYLKNSGCIEIVPKGENYQVSVTLKGKKQIKLLNFESLAVVREKRWNGRWWLILADIPSQDFKRAADLFRRKITDMGFFPLQRTVWLYPFDPRSELEFIVNYYGIQNFVTTMEVATLDPEDETKVNSFFRHKGLI